ncbi:transcription termination factor 4, mitochondrial [Lepisosteus oculatus]|uniref:transcription termination factor 4, mitochondrial n=1 Tax=Lepisosteus oculatus TaxID=7918 RepID=UPI0035F50390
MSTILWRQVLRWSILRKTRVVHRSELQCPVLKKWEGGHPVALCRKLCSSYVEGRASELHRQEVSPQGQEGCQETVRSLIIMGFTEAQATEVLEGPTGNRVGVAAKRFAMLSTLVALGLNPSTILKILSKCPELYLVKGAQMQQRIDNLRRLGLLEGNLQRVISHCPQLLTLTPKRVNTMARFLQEKCHFTGQQVTDILRDSPATLLEDMAQVEYKFQYAYFRMGVRHAEMLKSGLFRVCLDEVRFRHAFLERLGLYQAPDKKGQTRVVNPKLKEFLRVSEETFLTDVARATQEEFEVFRKLLARELKEESQEEKVESDSEGEDEEEGYESEDSDHTGYRRTRKK